MEIEFFQEFGKTMKPLSKALDILQSEKTCFKGYLLPTLYEPSIKLEKIQPMLHYCGPLATARINEIHVRFENMLNDKEIISAAILIPHFKTEWTSERDAIEKGAHFNSIAQVFLFLYPLFLEGSPAQTAILLNQIPNGFNQDLKILNSSCPWSSNQPLPIHYSS